MAEGFRVDLDALSQAARGVRGVLAQTATRRVDSIACPPDALGDARLAGALEGFCTRWAVGVANLAQDATTITDRLDRCAADYHAADGAARDSMLSGPGPDPGTR
jgi:hypothetical protein